MGDSMVSVLKQADMIANQKKENEEKAAEATPLEDTPKAAEATVQKNSTPDGTLAPADGWDLKSYYNLAPTGGDSEGVMDDTDRLVIDTECDCCDEEVANINRTMDWVDTSGVYSGGEEEDGGGAVWNNDCFDATAVLAERQRQAVICQADIERFRRDLRQLMVENVVETADGTRELMWMKTQGSSENKIQALKNAIRNMSEPLEEAAFYKYLRLGRPVLTLQCQIYIAQYVRLLKRMREVVHAPYPMCWERDDCPYISKWWMQSSTPSVPHPGVATFLPGGTNSLIYHWEFLEGPSFLKRISTTLLPMVEKPIKEEFVKLFAQHSEWEIDTVSGRWYFMVALADMRRLKARVDQFLWLQSTKTHSVQTRCPCGYAAIKTPPAASVSDTDDDDDDEDVEAKLNVSTHTFKPVAPAAISSPPAASTDSSFVVLSDSGEKTGERSEFVWPTPREVAEAKLAAQDRYSSPSPRLDTKLQQFVSNNHHMWNTEFQLQSPKSELYNRRTSTPKIKCEALRVPVDFANGMSPVLDNDYDTANTVPNCVDNDIIILDQSDSTCILISSDENENDAVDDLLNGHILITPRDINTGRILSQHEVSTATKRHAPAVVSKRPDNVLDYTRPRKVADVILCNNDSEEGVAFYDVGPTIKQAKLNTDSDKQCDDGNGSWLSCAGAIAARRESIRDKEATSASAEVSKHIVGLVGYGVLR